MRPSQRCVFIQQSDSLVRSSSELIVHRTRKASRSIPCPPIVTETSIDWTPRSVEQLPSSSNLKTGTPWTQSSEPVLFPQLRIYFADSPLPTLFCGPEATDLGDLTRFGVRSRVQINLSFGFSEADGSASDTWNDKVLYQPMNPIARQSDFWQKVVRKIKFPKLPPALPNSFALPYVIHVLAGE